MFEKDSYCFNCLFSLLFTADGYPKLGIKLKFLNLLSMSLGVSGISYNETFLAFATFLVTYFGPSSKPHSFLTTKPSSSSGILISIYGFIGSSF